MNGKTQAAAATERPLADITGVLQMSSADMDYISEASV
jgi:hypothetical protein